MAVVRARLLLVAIGVGVALGTGVDSQVRPIYDSGAAGLAHLLGRLQTTASVLHTGAHPDDEDSAFIARTARGDHARVAYLSLTRGEGRTEHHRSRAVRCARCHPHGGTASGAASRWGRTVLHARIRLRLLEDAGRGEIEVERARGPRRHGSRHPPVPAARDPLEVCGHCGRRSWSASIRRLPHSAGVRRGCRSGAVSRADRGGPATVAGAKAVSTGWPVCFRQRNHNAGADGNSGSGDRPLLRSDRG